MAATKGLLYELGLNNRPFAQALDSARGALSGFMSGVGKLGGLAGLAGGLVGAGSAALALKKAIDEAAQMETLTAGFEVLLGSVEAAQTRMQDLAQFAASTPFELPEIATASRTLETMTKGALATGRGLTLVGDLASGANQSFAEVAVTVGRLYGALQSGNAAGEPLQRLQEIGALSGDVRNKIEEMQKAGAPGTTVWAVAEQAIMRFSGSMQRQSQTWNGLMSTLQDNVNALFREFGTPLIDAFKPILTGAISLSGELAATARSWGESVAGAVRTTLALFQQGDLSRAAGLALRVGFTEAVEFLGSAMRSLFEALRGDTGGMFSGLKLILQELGYMLGSSIKIAIMEALNSVSVFGKKIVSDKSLAGAQRDQAGVLAGTEENLRIGVDRLFGQSVGKGIEDFFSGFAASGEDARAQLTALAESAKLASAQQAVNDNLMKVFAGTIGAFTLRPQVTGPAAGALRRIASVDANPLSDSVRRVGGIIGKGGPAGERAAQDTARNTLSTVNELKRANQRLGQLAAAPAGGRF